MMEFLNRLLQQLQTFWGTLSTRQRIFMGGSVAALLVGLTSLVYWANQIDYQPLFTNLSNEQSASIIESLKEKKEPYRISAGGSVIEVPSDRVLEMRMQLASEGILKDGVVGFELFDHSSIGATNFVERLNYQRALQGELTRTINQLEQIEGSRVHIVLPKESLFVNESKPASASVILKLKPGRRLSKEQIEGIASLVSSGVEGMKRENVSIVDTEGRMLAAPHEGSVANMPSNLLEYQQTMEHDLEQRIQTFLERVVGQGKVIAKVQATLDMRSTETTSEVFNPTSKVARSEQNRSETRTNQPGDAMGVPGTDSNLPENANKNASSKPGGMEKKENTLNYEIDKTVSRIVEAPGQLKRLTVAVLVDGTYKPSADGAKTEYVARTSQEMKLFDQIVRNAVGYSEDRSDEVTVSNLAFNQMEDEVVSESLLGVSWEKPARYGMVFLGMILVFLLIRPLLKTIATESQLAAQSKADMIENGNGELGLEDGIDTSELGDGGHLRLLTAGSQDRQRREQMIDLARSDIDNTVQTVKDWLRSSDQKKTSAT